MRSVVVRPVLWPLVERFSLRSQWETQTNMHGHRSIIAKLALHRVPYEQFETTLNVQPHEYNICTSYIRKRTTSHFIKIADCPEKWVEIQVCFFPSTIDQKEMHKAFIQVASPFKKQKKVLCLLGQLYKKECKRKKWNQCDQMKKGVTADARLV